MHTVACALAPTYSFRVLGLCTEDTGHEIRVWSFFLNPLCHRSHQKLQNKTSLKIALPPTTSKSHQTTKLSLATHSFLARPFLSAAPSPPNQYITVTSPTHAHMPLGASSADASPGQRNRANPNRTNPIPSTNPQRRRHRNR